MFDLFLICFIANVLSLFAVVLLFMIIVSIERKKRANKIK